MAEKEGNLIKLESATDGIFDFIYKTIFGLLLSVGLVILNNLIDFFWGSSIIEIYITITSSIILSVYFIFQKFSKVNFIYLIGWIIGLYILYRLNLSFFNISVEQLILWVILPTAIIIIRQFTHKKG